MKNFTYNKSYLKISIFLLLMMFSLSLVIAAVDNDGDSIPAGIDADDDQVFLEPGGAPVDENTIPVSELGDNLPRIEPDKKKTPALASSSSNTGWFSFPRQSAAQLCSAGSSSLSSGALGPIAKPFELILKLLSTELSVFVLMFIFFFMLMYGIFYVSLSKAKVFKDQKKQLKIIAVSLSFIVNLSFFGLTSRIGGPKAVLLRFMELGEVFGAIILLTLMFFVLYALFKREDSKSSDWKAILLGIGIAMVLVGQLLCRPTWTVWGMFALVIAAIAFLMTGLMGMGGGGTGGNTGSGGNTGNTDNTGSGGDTGTGDGPGTGSGHTNYMEYPPDPQITSDDNGVTLRFN